MPPLLASGPAAGPAMTLALALLVGIVAQSAARHLRIPGIVLLLGAGILLGPDVAGLIQPDQLGAGLDVLVGFAVAVILFEGGLNLHVKRLKREATTIRLLISVGALVSLVGGALAARLILDWAWRPAVLFGSLVIVTGPTVITPILRRCKVRRNLETVLEAESVLIDAVGAVVAVVALEVLTGSGPGGLPRGVATVAFRLAGGAGLGLAGGLATVYLLRMRNAVPEGLENVFTLSLVFLLFQGSNTLIPESGIVAAVAAGLVVGNSQTHAGRELKELKEFKEQLTVLLIGLLFVLLAADVRLADAARLGLPGLLLVVFLMAVVRPMGVLACTWRSGLGWREKAFVAWLGPRGIVAAAVASLFGERLAAAGMEGGQEMRALVFLVITVTVLVQGSTAGWLAGALGLRRPMGQGVVLLGANPLARVLARFLVDGGEEVVLVDGNARHCTDAEKEGLRVLYGNALEERILLAAGVESRRAAVGLVPNEAVNLLFARKARELKVPAACVALQKGDGSVGPAAAAEAGAAVLFGEEVDLELWATRIRRRLATPEVWVAAEVEDEARVDPAAPDFPSPEHHGHLLVLAREREGKVDLFTAGVEVRRGDRLLLLIFDEHEAAPRPRLVERGFRPA